MRGRQWPEILQRDIIALRLIAYSHRAPRHTRVIAGSVAAYARSPIGLLPDVVPFLRWVDTYVLVPVSVMVAVQFVPRALMNEFRWDATQLPWTATSQTGRRTVVALRVAMLMALVVVSAVVGPLRHWVTRS